MLKGRDILEKPVVSYDTGERFDRVKDLLFDQNTNQLLGFLLSEKGWFSSAKVILLKDIQAIGPNAVIIPSKDSVSRAKEIPSIDRILEHNNILKGTRIMTTDGRDLGTMVDMYFDERTGSVEGYEVSGGLFADAYSGRSFVPALQTLKIGEDVAFVPSHTAEYMEEQVGGIKAAVQNASVKVQDTAQATGEKLQELGQVTSQRLQSAAEVTGEKFQEFTSVAGEKAQVAAETTNLKFQELARSANTSLTNAVVDPSEQKAFALGKTALESVDTPNGQILLLKGEPITPLILDTAESLGILDAVFRAAGGRLSEKVGDRIGSAVASLGIDRALGRRIQQIVRTDGGIIIAAPGQIVTETVIARAKTYRKEQAILNAVGLSSSDLVRDRTQQFASVTGSRLRSTTQSTGEQLQAGARQLWIQVKEAANELQGRSAEAIEEQRIRGALGRPVTRVILDRNDNVILNVGELITHHAISSARESDVLDLLLNSVYTETPKLSLQDMRAPQAGQAAL
ncbi:PRC-barrel domain-containing protein [Altericista sp. CCNU0014]|uniref:PRC-barrel domain-containing protein n=1 Tax=Altericista sp. CCNU0014 TaxID=3082949 RepID=UPI00384C7AAF